VSKSQPKDRKGLRQELSLLRNRASFQGRKLSYVEVLHRPSDRGDGDRHPYSDCGRGHHHKPACGAVPNIVPPEIQLQASYVGADAQTLEQSVATPIEQQINGVDNVNYMYSLNATGNSQTTMVVDFDLKTDPNTDLILTQSREQLAAGQLPPDVNTYGSLFESP